MVTFVDGLAFDNAYFGAGDGAIHMDNVVCRGNEPSILNCSFVDPHLLSDRHWEDAGVRCYSQAGIQLLVCAELVSRSDLFTDLTGNICNHGDLRLVGGSSLLNGRVEVCFDNQWGSVCSTWWSLNDANVVCGQVGHASAGLINTALCFLFHFYY